MKGSTLHVLPICSKIKVFLPSTTISAWVSNSDLEFALCTGSLKLTAETIALIVYEMGLWEEVSFFTISAGTHSIFSLEKYLIL